MAFPDIVIGSSFDGKGFKQALTASEKLEKNVKNLAKGFLGVFAAQKVLAFGKASVKAFAADDAAAKSLGMTLKNLGLAYGANVGTVNGFIGRLEMQTGVLDDELRPAMDRLLRATGDVAKSQELLGLALDIAAGTGKSVTQVSQSLQKAYLGQTAALGRLGVGLSKAELSTGNFEDIQKKLNTLFAGQATTAAGTYQGSLNKLQVAANNAKETIGKGLVDALGTLSNSENVDGTVSAIDRIAKSISNATVDFAKFIKVSKDFLGTGFFLSEAEKTALLATKMGTKFTTPMTISSQDTQRADKAAADAAKKAADAKIKADKAAAAAKILADKKTAANKAKLDKAAAVFDLTKIQIAAALKGKITEEEKTRLLLMQAIADEDATKAEALQKKLEEIQKKNEEIAKSLLAIGQAKDPFATWSTSLTAALLELNKVGERMFAIRQRESGFVDTSILGGGGGGGGTTGGTTFPANATPSEIVAIAETAVVAAEAAVAEAAASVEATQTNTEALAASADAALTLATEMSVAADIADQSQTSSIYNPYAGITPQTIAAAQAATLLAAGSNAGAGTSSSMFNPYATTPGSSAGFGTQGNYTYPPITINIEGMIDTDNFEGIMNQAMLNAIRKGLPQSVAGQLPG